MNQNPDLSSIYGESQEFRVTILGDNASIYTTTWLFDRHREFLVKPRNALQIKIEDYLNSRSIRYVFKNPVWLKGRSYFVDYFIPSFRVIVDIRPLMSSEFFNAEIENQRRRRLKSLGYTYLPVDFSDLREDRVIRKLKRALGKSIDNLYKI